jgi:hypothetical protein
LPVHDDRQDRVEGLGGLVGRVGELHGAGLHAAAGEHLALEHHRVADLAGDAAGVGGGAREPALAERQPVAREQRLGLVFVEAHELSRSAGVVRVTPRTLMIFQLGGKLSQDSGCGV